MFDSPPTDRLAEIGTKYQKQVFVTPLTAMWYLPMNTRLPPFDNIKARQAVAYAIDRKSLVNLFGGPVLASPICQVLPPGFPGHEPYCPFTKDSGAKWTAPDMAKAPLNRMSTSRRIRSASMFALAESRNRTNYTQCIAQCPRVLAPSQGADAQLTGPTRKGSRWLRWSGRSRLPAGSGTNPGLCRGMCSR